LTYDNCLNVGCGNKPIKGWINIDNSPAIKLASQPQLYRLFKTFGFLNENQVQFIEWNKNNKIVFADISREIPAPNDSIRIIYSSHMLEHLSCSDAEKFLVKSMEKLSHGGSIRLVVPDLKKIINEYLINPDADSFMENMMVSAPEINTLKQKISVLLRGYRHHQWMYDENSLLKVLDKIGYKNVVSLKAGETTIDHVGNLDLFERQENSLYVEAKKL